MTIVRALNGDTFEAGCDMIEVTSMHRPDTSWAHIDAQGHEHRWYVEGGGPDGQHISAGHYNPSAKHITPSLAWIFERWGYYEDGERYAIGHHECCQCGERIEPRYTADNVERYVPGLRWFRINGRGVDEGEFRARYAELKERS